MFVHRRTFAQFEVGSGRVYRTAGIIWCLTVQFSWLQRATLRSSATTTRSDHLQLAPGWAVGKPSHLKVPKQVPPTGARG